ncbi:Riboflavin synthase alpha chain [Rhodotorula kratochvilovae]
MFTAGSPLCSKLRSRERDSLESRACQLRPLMLPYRLRAALGPPAPPLDVVSALPCRRRPWSALAMFSRVSRALREVLVADEGTEADAGEDEVEPDDERAMLASLEKALLALGARPGACALAGPGVGSGCDDEESAITGSARAGGSESWLGPATPVFTGLVEILGTIKSISPTTAFEGYSFVIGDAAEILVDCKLGDSIAVNGVCLTVTRWDAGEGWFEVGLANETLSRSNLGKLVVGSKVNLERAMAGHGRFGGHFVQGHVDTTAKILSITPDGDSLRLLFSLPLEFYTPLIPKGYIALDGTSLTLTHLSVPKPGEEHYEAGRGVFGVMLVVHTQSRTVVAMKAVGESVNVECDVVGKGVESVVRNVLEGGGEQGGALELMVERAVERVLARKGLLQQ